MKNNEAAWILNTLTFKGVLALETVQMERLTADDDKWNTLVRSHLDNNDTEAPRETDPLEVRLMFENAGKNVFL